MNKIITQHPTILQTGRKQFTHNFKNDLIALIPERMLEEGCYAIGDKRYPSITTVLGLMSAKDINAWKKRIGEEAANTISRKAALRGTKFHALCEIYLKNLPFDSDAFENHLTRQMFINSLQHLNMLDDIHLIETRLWSDHLRIAGTVDCIARYDGKLSVVDFKTANKSKKKEWIESYFMQAAGYSIMFEELTRIPVANLVIIIAVEGEHTQVFKEKRDNWVKQLLSCRDEYEKIYRTRSVDNIV